MRRRNGDIGPFTAGPFTTGPFTTGPLEIGPLRLGEPLAGLARSHPVACRLVGLAVGHAERGEYDEAASLLKYVFEITERTLGKAHRMVVAIRERYDDALAHLTADGEASRRTAALEPCGARSEPAAESSVQGPFHESPLRRGTRAAGGVEGAVPPGQEYWLG